MWNGDKIMENFAMSFPGSLGNQLWRTSSINSQDSIMKDAQVLGQLFLYNFLWNKNKLPPFLVCQKLDWKLLESSQNTTNVEIIVTFQFSGSQLDDGNWDDYCLKATNPIAFATNTKSLKRFQLQWKSSDGFPVSINSWLLQTVQN